MKKNFKLALALILSLMMVLGSIAALADSSEPPTTGSITINDSADGKVDASQRTFNAYRILNATEVFNADDATQVTGVAYTIPNDFIRGQLATWLVLTKEDGETDAAFDQRIIDAMAAKKSASEVEAMAKKLLEIAKNANSGLTAVPIVGETKKTGLEFGYYVIEDTGNKDSVSAIMLNTNAPDVAIHVKATVPELDKKIDESPTQTATGTYDADDLVYDNHRIGDTVPYVLRSYVPLMTGYTKYYYIVKDTLSKGLTFNDNVAIKIGDTALVKDNDFTVTSSANADGSTAIEIVFKNFIQYRGTLVTDEMVQADGSTYTTEQIGSYVGSREGEIITITYGATVNQDAVIGVEGNPNTAQLIFSNNPNEEVDHEPGNDDKPHDITVIGNTPESTVWTFVTGLKLLKVDSNDTSPKPLAGATFELSGNLNKVEVIKGEKYVAADDGAYWKLNDGTYTTTDPDNLDKTAENYDATIAKYVKEGDKYLRFNKTAYNEKTASGDPKTVSETTGEDGIIIFDGMGDGKFTLTETEAPTGYNKLETPIEFEVVWTKPATNSTECTWEIKTGSIKPTDYQVTFDPNAGEFTITIKNETGTLLPSTGGIGTTIFYVAGSLMVLAAAILLITKRRMGAND